MYGIKSLFFHSIRYSFNLILVLLFIEVLVKFFLPSNYTINLGRYVGGFSVCIFLTFIINFIPALLEKMEFIEKIRRDDKNSAEALFEKGPTAILKAWQDDNQQ